MISILPADTYIVVNKSVITELDKKIINMLYQPIIGYQAVALYLTLLSDLDKKEDVSVERTHYHLMTNMQLKLDEILSSREKLEAIGLLKTYYKEDHINNYIYELYSPISPSEFINHPILGVILYNNLGKKEYIDVCNYFKVTKINTKDYKEITKRFDQVFSTVSGRNLIENDDIKDKKTNKITLNHSVDMDLIISSIPSNMVSPNCFNNDIKELINSLSYTYNIDDISMQGIVRDSLNEQGLIDKTLLRKNARASYEFEHIGKLPTLIYNVQPDYLKSPEGDNSNWAKMVYVFENTTPYDYLKSKNGGVEPSSRDLKLIESLLADMELKPGVVNVLLSYVLKINDQKLNKNYIEAIAGQWKRLKIETVEDAMRQSIKDHKRTKKKLDSIKPLNTKKEEVVPDWFNEDLDKEEISEEEQEELNSIINNI